MSHLSLAIKQLENGHHVQMGEGAAYGVKRANGNRYANTKSRFAVKLAEVNKELWIILTLLVFAGLMNYVVASHRMILSFYFLPTLFSAYVYGRRHAVLTAFASSFLVGLLVYYKPGLFTETLSHQLPGGHWYDVTCWAGLLVVTAYAMGTLHERHERRLQELKQTYRGILLILRNFISKDKYTENHCYRVSIYAAKIAACLGLDEERIEDVRDASLLHDLGKLEVSRSILYKAAQLTSEEYEVVKQHTDTGADMLKPVGGPLARIIPIILGHHDRFDGSGYHPKHGTQIPIEARVIAVADVYDALTSDRPYRKAMSPFDAKETIVKAKGIEFDPEVVEAFLGAFSRGEMEVPEVVV
jgi:putative nucleotidyltransferase with HDIG domain